MTDRSPLVDRVVDAVVSRSPAVSRLALRYFHDASTDPWDLDEIESGGFVPWDNMDTWIDRAENSLEGFEWLKPLVTAERYAEILDNAPLTAEEERQALRAALFDYFEAPADGWGYRLLAVPDSAGRQAVMSVIVTGGPGVLEVFMGIHRSQSDAIAALKRYGLIDAEDLGQASPRRRRLSEAQLKARSREF